MTSDHQPHSENPSPTPIDFLIFDIQQTIAQIPERAPYTYRDGFTAANEEIIAKIKGFGDSADTDAAFRETLRKYLEDLQIDAALITTTLQADQTYGVQNNPLELRKAFIESGRSMAFKLAVEIVSKFLAGADV